MMTWEELQIRPLRRAKPSTFPFFQIWNFLMDLQSICRTHSNQSCFQGRLVLHQEKNWNKNRTWGWNRETGWAIPQEEQNHLLSLGLPWLISGDIYLRLFVVNSEANEVSVIWRAIPLPCQFNPILERRVGNKMQNFAFTCNTKGQDLLELASHHLSVFFVSVLAKETFQ